MANPRKAPRPSKASSQSPTFYTGFIEAMKAAQAQSKITGKKTYVYESAGSGQRMTPRGRFDEIGQRLPDKVLPTSYTLDRRFSRTKRSVATIPAPKG